MAEEEKGRRNRKDLWVDMLPWIVALRPLSSAG